MDKILILFTMKGCPYCEIMKESLNENNIEYFVRDINQHKEEYDLFNNLMDLIQSNSNNLASKIQINGHYFITEIISK